MLAPLLLLVLSVVLSGIASPVSTKAEDWGGIAMSGSFYTQSFEIPQGSSVSGPSIYVTVHNTSDELLHVKMYSTVPDGVTLTLSSAGIGIGSAEEFDLLSGEQRQLLIAVAVADIVPPETYSIMISAEGYRDTGEGLAIVGSAAEEATLTVIGESAVVTVDSLAPSGEPVTGTIRLFRVIGDNQYECASSTTGHLEARVPPGHYVVWAEMNGTKQEGTEQEFDLVADEQKSLTLTIEIIYFELFDILPAYHPETNELGAVRISYTVRNVYQQVDKAEVRLVVTRNGDPLEEVSILTMEPLGVGRTGVPWDYTPSAGWQDGTYGFSLRLFINGELYASTNEKTLDVDVPGGSSSLLFIILGIIGGGLLLGILIFALARRRKKGDKPEKAAKKKAKVKADKKAKAKEEAPAPAAPAPGVEILFGREMPELKDEEPAPGLTRAEAVAPPKEAAKPSVPPKPVVEKPSTPKPAEAAAPGVTRETAPPKKETAPATPPSAAAPKPSQPPAGVRPAEAKPVQAAGAPRPGETTKSAVPPPQTGKPAPESGPVKPAAPSAPPKAEPPVKPVAEPARPAAPQPAGSKPVPAPEAPKPAQPGAPRVVVPPVIKPAEPAKPPPAQPAAPRAPEPAAAKPAAEREAPKPPLTAPSARGTEGTTTPAAPAGREADSLRQMPPEKASGKPDLRLVSALEQRMSRVRKGSQPDFEEPGGSEAPSASEVRPSESGPRPATEKTGTDEGPVQREEPAGEEKPETGQSVPDKAEEAQETAAEPRPASTGDQKPGDQQQRGEDDDDDKGDKKFTSPIRFLNQ